MFDDLDPSLSDLLVSRPFLSLDAQKGLMMEGIPLINIIHKIGTPLWVTGAGTIRDRFHRLQLAFTDTGLSPHIFYAVKANDNLAVLNLLNRIGAGADIVSEGELARALKVGIPPNRIVFSGVGKTSTEIDAALQAGIKQFNVESREELFHISRIASSKGTAASVVLRVNPDVDAKTHTKITTGKSDNKFGIAFEEVIDLYKEAMTLPAVNPKGLAVHIGSQITNITPFKDAFVRLSRLIQILKSYSLPVERLDCGGGFGISYRHETESDPIELAHLMRTIFGTMGLELALEPGRWLIGPAGILLTQTLYKKKGRHNNPSFLIVDASMSDLIRPALYNAWHGILPLSSHLYNSPVELLDVVGTVCESSDSFAHNRLLPVMHSGEYLAILDTGAYGAAMSSHYNARPFAAQVMIEGANWQLTRHRQPLDFLWQHEILPTQIDPSLSTYPDR